jgi:tape measure domain-containing protein
MATVATLETRMALNSTAFRQGMIQAASQANDSLGSISKKAGETASVLLSLKRAADTFGTFYLVKEGIGSLLEAQKQLQAIHYTLIAATGSSTQASDAFKFVADESQRMGLVLPEAASGFANLSASATAAGVTLTDQKKLFDAYSKSATSLHLDTTQSNRALLALEQMFAKGKIQAQELRLQLGQAIPGAAQRFQNAVMEMTKGTDLAGKSFDQLLSAGELTTSKFLPALVTALEMSGRGWEEASKGLNSNLNRVRTAWFNLKTEVSSGLFNEAATAGAGLLADNLGRVASAVSLIGAGGLARVLGGQIDSGASKVTRLAQEAQGSRMAAAAEATYAAKVAATAEAEAAAAAVQKGRIATRQADGAAFIAENRQILYNAELQVESAAALKARQVALGGAAQSAMVLEVAEERLGLALAEQAVAQARVNAEMALATPLSDKYTAAQARLVVAENAVVAAQARVVETRAAEAAIGGLTATAGRAAKSIGTFALSLVGGWTGAAVLAIGAVGYAIYKVNADWDDYLKHADEVAKSNVEVTQTLRDLALAYQDVNTRPDAAALSSGLDAAATAATKARQELDDLIAKRAELEDQQQRMTARGGPSLLLDPKIGELDAKIAHARSTLDDLTSSAGKAQQELAAELAPAVLNSVNPALDLLATRVYGARDAFAALQGLASIPSSLGDLVAQATDASKAFKAYTAEATAAGDASLKSIQKHGKSNEGLAQVRLDLLKNSTAWKSMTADQRSAAVAQEQTEAALGRGVDALSNKTKTHKDKVDQAAEAYKNLSNAQQGQIATLKGQLAGTDGYGEAQKTLNTMLAGGSAEFRKMTAAHQAEVIATQRQIVADTQAVSLMNLKIDSARKLADMDRELAREQEDRARASASQVEGVGHGSQWNAERQAIDAVTAATRQKMDAEGAAYRQAIDLADKQNKTAAERAVIDQDHLAMQGKITAAGALGAKQTQDDFDAMRAAQGSWENGIKAGIEDFQTQQQNNAAAGKKMVDDLTGGFTNAFTAFASGAENAKTAFGSWIDDMYKQALAFVANKAIQALFDSFSQTGGGSKSSTPGSSAGGWASLAGNVMNAFGFSSGPGTIGAGLAGGGSAHAWGAYPVAENGPEILKVGHRSILMMGDQSGTVVPNNQIGRAAGNTTVTNIYVQPTTTRRTADQIATANARTQRIATSRNG